MLTPACPAKVSVHRDPGYLRCLDELSRNSPPHRVRKVTRMEQAIITSFGSPPGVIRPAELLRSLDQGLWNQACLPLWIQGHTNQHLLEVVDFLRIYVHGRIAIHYVLLRLADKWRIYFVLLVASDRLLPTNWKAKAPPNIH